MDAQKGNLKDRLRARYLYLQYIKNKRKKEKELAKKKTAEYEARIRAEQIRIYGKPYSKFKATFLTLFGLLIGLFTPKSYKKTIDDELQIIEKEKKQILVKLEQDTDIKEVYTRIDNTYQKLEDIKKKYHRQLVVDSFNPTSKSKLLNTIDSKQKELIVMNEMCHDKEKQIQKTINVQNSIMSTQSSKIEKGSNKIDNHMSKENDDYKKSESANDLIISSGKEKVLPSYSNVNSVKASSNNKDNVNLTNENDTPKLINTVKHLNLEIKSYSKDMLQIKEKVNQEQLYSTLFDYEFTLKQLYMRLKKILDDYEILKEKYNLEELNNIIDIDVIDKFELRKTNEQILKKIDECKSILELIEEKKEILSTKKQRNVGDVTNTKEGSHLNNKEMTKSKEKEKEKKELKEQYDDIYLANKIIINNIIKEQKALLKIKRKIYNQKPLTKMQTAVLYARKFTRSILDFGFSLFPIKYFKNRALGALVSGIMLNNSLRTVRRLVTLESYKGNYILYNDLIKEIQSNEDYISKLYNICLDSQEQIANIKNHLSANFSMIRETDDELSEFYRELDTLSEQIDNQLENLKETNLGYQKVRQRMIVQEENRTN